MILLMILFLNSAAVLGPYAEFSFDDKVYKADPIKKAKYFITPFISPILAKCLW